MSRLRHVSPRRRLRQVARVLIGVWLFTAVLTAAAATSKTATLTGSDANASMLAKHFKRHPAPGYPLEARIQHLQGKGVFLLNFARTGKVASITVVQSTGSTILDQACLKAFKRWTTPPGEFVAVRIPINFSFGGP